jgi:hypothetical protein
MGMRPRSVGMASLALGIALTGACANDTAGSSDRTRAGSGGTTTPMQASDPSMPAQGASGGAAPSVTAGTGAPSTEPSRGGAGTGGTQSPGSGDFTSGLTPPDPNVTFDWAASLPVTGDCLPGRYTGTFTCEYFFMAGDPAPLAVVTGPVAITLEESQDGEFLEITDGKLEGIAQLIFGFRAELEGRLECATRRLDATAVNGQYGFGDPAVLPLGTFEGALGGLLDTAAGMLDGDWDLSVTAGGAGGFCKGPWQANWAP